MANRLVSIIMPLYNCADFVEDAIKSIFEQTYSNWELIVVDDCSTDSGHLIIEKYSKKNDRVNLIRLNRNCGAGVARNVGLKYVKGELVAYLDSDDVWKNYFLEEQIKYMDDKNTKFVFSSYERWDENFERQVLKPFIVPLKVSYGSMLKTCDIAPSTVLYDFKSLKHIKWKPEAFKREDLVFFLDILKEIKYSYGNKKVLVKYRIHKGSLSSNKFNMLGYQFKAYWKVEGLSFIKSFYYTMIWAINGVIKYSR